MVLRELSRKRLVIALALVLPPVFFAAVLATAGNRILPIELASADGAVVRVQELRQSLVFIGVAAAALVAAFFASNLIQQQVDANRRLVLSGYRSSELIAARLLVLLGVIGATSAYTWLIAGLFARELFAPGVLLGMAGGAFVYGCYGLLVGALFKRDLESIFAIIVLINIDAGWLQNPVYYAEAGSKWLIEALPAHYPSQVAYISAFTSRSIGAAMVGVLAYGALFLAVAVAIYGRRMQVVR
jgi:hypothetical protein